MSRAFRDADMTAELAEQAAAQLLAKVRADGAAQARHAAELRAAGRQGLCEDCGSAIESDRLKFVPDATRCVSCQSLREQRPGH